MGKKNPYVEEMYKLYQDGYSLQQVGEIYGQSRQSVHELFKSRGLQLRIKKRLPFKIFNGKKYTLRNNGYYASTSGKRSLMHRDVWEHFNGKIPKDHDIHHIDRDKTNNKLSNLECLSKTDHARMFSSGNNQYTKGK